MTQKEGWKGRYYEDFELGDVYRCPFGRTVIDADNVWFTLLTMNTNQIHFNEEYAKRTEFGKRLVDSTFTFALVTGMSVSDLTMNSVANLGWDEIRLPNPVFEGDTIYEESEVLSKRESKSRPYAGIVTALTKGLNQKNETVIQFKRTFMVYKQGHVPQDQKT
jgi:acyl dehydratase